jgi:hypothetical protein
MKEAAVRSVTFRARTREASVVSKLSKSILTPYQSLAGEVDLNSSVESED